jgi:hypothetical protein
MLIVAYVPRPRCAGLNEKRSFSRSRAWPDKCTWLVSTNPESVAHSQVELYRGLIVVRRAKWRFVAFVRNLSQYRERKNGVHRPHWTGRKSRFKDDGRQLRYVTPTYARRVSQNKHMSVREE